RECLEIAAERSLAGEEQDQRYPTARRVESCAGYDDWLLVAVEGRNVYADRLRFGEVQVRSGGSTLDRGRLGGQIHTVTNEHKLLRLADHRLDIGEFCLPDADRSRGSPDN